MKEVYTNMKMTSIIFLFVITAILVYNLGQLDMERDYAIYTKELKDSFGACYQRDYVNGCVRVYTPDNIGSLLSYDEGVPLMTREGGLATPTGSKLTVYQTRNNKTGQGQDKIFSFAVGRC